MFSNGFDHEGRSRRSLASLSGDIPSSTSIYEDPDKFQHPPNITPVGGVPNLKVTKPGCFAKVIRYKSVLLKWFADHSVIAALSAQDYHSFE